MPGLRIPSAVKQGLYKGTLFVTVALAMLASLVGLSHGWPGLPVFPLAAVIWIGLFWSASMIVLRPSTRRFATELPADTAGRSLPKSREVINATGRATHLQASWRTGVNIKGMLPLGSRRHRMMRRNVLKTVLIDILL